MASTPPNEEPGFERDENELPEERDNGSPDTLEDGPIEDDDADTDAGTDIEEPQDQEQPQQGGYQ